MLLEHKDKLYRAILIEKFGVETTQLLPFWDRSGRYFHDFDRLSPFKRRVQVIIWRNSLHQVAIVRAHLNGDFCFFQFDFLFFF